MKNSTFGLEIVENFREVYSWLHLSRVWCQKISSCKKVYVRVQCSFLKHSVNIRYKYSGIKKQMSDLCFLIEFKKDGIVVEKHKLQ